MSKFEVKVVKIDEVTNHPDADRLSLNRIGGFIAVSNKQVVGLSDHEPESNGYDHRYQAGQLVVYVPEGAVVPLELLEQFGYTDADGKGILAGSKGNRVKAIKLRGVVSQGLIFPLRESVPGMLPMVAIMVDFKVHVVDEGQDVAELLGITKYEPEIPASMSGDVFHAPALTLKFDLENAQKYPDVFDPDEIVHVTEKLHGTFCGFVFVPHLFVVREGIEIGKMLPIGEGVYATAYSKGLGEKGLVFDASPDNIQKNVYLRALKEIVDNRAHARMIIDNVDYLGKFTILGEVYGKGIQDLHYGLDKPKFAAFNFVDSDNKMMAARAFQEYVIESDFPTVPLVAVERFETLLERLDVFRDGKSLIDGKTVREGIVVVPETEGRDDRFGRRALKMISPDYLIRKNATEYN